MTMIAVVRTSSDVVIAADSKISTMGIIGKNPDGTFNFGPKSYSSGTKIVVSASGGLVCAMAGVLGFGESPMDYFRSLHLFEQDDGAVGEAEQASELHEACLEFGRRRAVVWKDTGRDPSDWPGTTLLLSAYHPTRWCPRVWKVTYSGEIPEFEEILEYPGIQVEGSPIDAMCLLYGMHLTQAAAIATAVNVDTRTIIQAARSALLPLDKINFRAMPLQDAVDFAHFIVSVQVQMDRYISDQDACGGAIDMAIVHGNPRKRVRVLPGKELRHPSTTFQPIVSDPNGRMP